MPTDPDVYEALKRIKSRLDGDPDWEFSDWSSCTCGHIYAVTENKGLEGEEEVVLAAHPKKSLYSRVLRKVAEVTVRKSLLGSHDRSEALIGLVSDETSRRAFMGRPHPDNDVGGRYDDDRLNGARQMIDLTLDAIEAEYEVDRQARLSIPTPDHATTNEEETNAARV